MFVKKCSFLCLTFMLAATVIAGENNTLREADGFARLLCAVLQSSNSGDPEIRSNAVVEGLAYLDGEAADVLRVLLLTKEENPAIREALIKQLSRSERRTNAVDCLRHLTQNAQPQTQKSRLQEVIHELEIADTAGIFYDKAKTQKQPIKYTGPLSMMALKTLHDGETRTRTYRVLAAQHSRTSTEILQLFRAIETDSKRAKDLDRQIAENEDARTQPPR